MVKKKRNISLLELGSIFLIPLAVFWILWRFGLSGILDAVAVAVLIAVLIFWILKFMLRQKVISFKKKT